MLRYQNRAVIQILLKPKALCSTASQPKENIQLSLIQKLSKEFSDIAPVMRIMKKHDVKNIHFDEWKSRIYVMKSYHFKDKECFQMISRYPLLLKIPINNFEDNIEQWYDSDLGLNNFHLVLLNNPELTEVDATEIQKRLPVLRSTFKTSNNLVELLIKSPNVMCDDWLNLLSKINYLLNEKRFSRREIIDGCALSKSMDFIQLRIDILEKCGIFKKETKPIHKINKYDKTKHTNPHLKRILLSNTEDFVRIAKISAEEYAACRDLFMSQEEDDEDVEENTYRR